MIRFNRFKYHRQVEGVVKRSPAVRDHLQEVVDDMAGHARAIAPVGSSGNYRDSLEGIVYMAADGLRGRLLSTDWKAHLIEWGTIDTPAFHVLQRAAQTSGLRFRAVRR